MVYTDEYFECESSAPEQRLVTLIDSYTKECVNYEETTVWYDGTVMDDSKVDGVIYRKKGIKYYARQYGSKLDVRWFGAKCDGVTNDYPAIMKAISFANNNQSIYIPDICVIETPIVTDKALNIIGTGSINGNLSSQKKSSTLWFKIPNDSIAIETTNGLVLKDIVIATPLDFIDVPPEGFSNKKTAIKSTWATVLTDNVNFQGWNLCLELNNNYYSKLDKTFFTYCNIGVIANNCYNLNVAMCTFNCELQCMKLIGNTHISAFGCSFEHFYNNGIELINSNIVLYSAYFESYKFAQSCIKSSGNSRVAIHHSHCYISTVQSFVDAYSSSPHSNNHLLSQFNHLVYPPNTLHQVSVVDLESSPKPGDKYTHNGIEYTIKYARVINGAGVIYFTGTSVPQTTGTLTKITGNGSNSISFTDGGNVIIEVYKFYSYDNNSLIIRGDDMLSPNNNSANLLYFNTKNLRFRKGYVNIEFPHNHELHKTPFNSAKIVDVQDLTTDSTVVNNEGAIIFAQNKGIVGNDPMNIHANYGYKDYRAVYQGGQWEKVGIRLQDQPDSTATDITTLKNDFNSLLAKLRANGVMV